MIQSRRTIYFVLPLIGFVLVAASTLTPNIAYAERIPFAIRNVTQSSSTAVFEGMYQVAVLLPQRDDGKFYTGQLTYTASAPVEVAVLAVSAANATGGAANATGGAANATGGQSLSGPGLNASLAAFFTSEPRQFNTVSFAGSELALVYRGTQPFTVSYAVVGETLDPEPLPQ
jgi:hypothetical protein